VPKGTKQTQFAENPNKRKCCSNKELRRTSAFSPRKNKPNSNPIQTQTNPIGWRRKMNVNKVLTVDYENKRLFRRTENKPNQTQRTKCSIATCPTPPMFHVKHFFKRNYFLLAKL
jgi:hypothetical protein